MRSETAPIVLTSCGKRKSCDPSPALCAGALPAGDPASVARTWAGRVAAARTRIPARQLYQGRAFREVELAARPVAAEVYIISAGLGLVGADDPIPSYSLTVASGPDNILARLEPSHSSLSWWRALSAVSQSPSFEELLARSSGLVLLAAGRSYLSMVWSDLASLRACDRQRLRLFTAAPRDSILDDLRDITMPYDARLESFPGRAGTLSDFAQRALRHFIEVILPACPDGDAPAHAALVSATLKGAQPPVRKRGRSVSDDEIAALIRANWNQANGKSAAMLRLLRDSFAVACEQKRFKKLFALARAERGS